ncbi:MAG TPA: hypothetical protein DCR55_10240 [Lentisphaeria bacterium]|nr:hypothetical protein [Lentisphaeria bacterium]
MGLRYAGTVEVSCGVRKVTTGLEMIGFEWFLFSGGLNRLATAAVLLVMRCRMAMRLGAVIPDVEVRYGLA